MFYGYVCHLTLAQSRMNATGAPTPRWIFFNAHLVRTAGLCYREQENPKMWNSAEGKQREERTESIGVFFVWKFYSVQFLLTYVKIGCIGDLLTAHYHNSFFNCSISHKFNGKSTIT